MVHQKKSSFGKQKRIFLTKFVLADGRNPRFTRVKSLRDEIRTSCGRRTDLILPSGRRSILPKAKGFDFTIADINSLCYDAIKVIVLAESKPSELSMEFAVKVLRLCDSIKGHYSLINRPERSATSIDANIREANYAYSKADFVSKFQISLKECCKTECWLEILERSNLVSHKLLSILMHDCGSIHIMLVLL